MSANTSIEWTEKTWNPVRGCALVSPGCKNCYAQRQAHRFSGPGKPYEGLTRIGPNGPTWTGAIRTVPDALDEPLRWRKPQRIFVNSMSDLFHPDVPDDFIDRVFAVMALCPQHTFQVLTKRPERMRAYLTAFDDEWESRLEVAIGSFLDGEWIHRDGKHLRSRIERGISAVMGIWIDDDCEEHAVEQLPWPLPNVWLGVSVENQHYADERIPQLLATPAAVRFISAEPLLGPVDLDEYLPSSKWHGSQHPMDAPLSWVIVGGESGPHSRACDLAWIRHIVAQCDYFKTPCFVKQLGARPVVADPDADWSVGAPDGTFGIRDKKGGDWDEWPADLRVRQFPGESDRP